MMTDLRKKRLIYGIIFGMAATLAIIIGFSVRAGSQLGSKYTPLIDACMVVKAEAAKAMVCFDEIIFNDKRADPGELDRRLKEAEWYAHAIWHGGSNWENNYQAVTGPLLIEKSEQLSISLEKYRDGLESSMEAMNRQITDERFDNVTDSLYAQVQAQADELEEMIQASWKTDLARFRSLQIALISTCAILGLLIAILLFGYEKTRAATLAQLKQANSELKTELGERQRAEMALRTIFDTAPGLIIILDEIGKIIDCNESVKKLLLFESDEILGKPFDTIVHAGSSARASANLQKTVAQGYLYGQEYKFIRKNLDIIDVRMNSSCIHDENGHLINIVCVVDDIGEAKTREKRLLDQHQLLRTTIESLSHPFYMIDANTYQLIIANRASGYNVDSDETAGPQTCYELTHGSSIPCHLAGETCPINAVKSSGQPAIVEHRHLDNNGNLRFYEVHGYPVFDAENKVSRIIEYLLRYNRQKEIRRRTKGTSRKTSTGRKNGGLGYSGRRGGSRFE